MQRTCYDNGHYKRFAYGPKAYPWEGGNLYYGVCPVGIEVRRQIGHHYIYRVRRGNGYYDSILNQKYQDKYKYFVPSSINNPESEPSRQCFANAILAWQNLTEEEKQNWRDKEKYIKYMSGYNIFIRQYFKDNFNP